MANLSARGAPQHMDTITQKHIAALVAMHEDDFSRQILKPLFEAMGYERVEFNGGPLERGRDLIAQRKLPPREAMHVTYIQSKKIGSLKNARTSAKLSQLLHQLRQCCLGKVTTVEGTELPVDEVYLACPEPFTSRLLEELSTQLFNQKPQISPYCHRQCKTDPLTTI